LGYTVAGKANRRVIFATIGDIFLSCKQRRRPTQHDSNPMAWRSGLGISQVISGDEAVVNPGRFFMFNLNSINELHIAEGKVDLYCIRISMLKRIY
jgi:hypothetical protein